MEILIIEDDKYTLEMYELVFKKAGHQISTTGDGETGLQMATSADFDCVLLDIMLPKINGLDILKKIRQKEKKEKREELPVVMLTNLGQEDVYQECQKLGVSDYIIKARLTPHEVLERVERIVAQNPKQ